MEFDYTRTTIFSNCFRKMFKKNNLCYQYYFFPPKIFTPKIFHLNNNSPIEYQSCADSTLDDLVKKDNDKCVCKTPCEVRR